jgi:hypothetical protein
MIITRFPKTFQLPSCKNFIGRKKFFVLYALDEIAFLLEPLAKLLKARGNGHSGQAKRDPESRIFKQFWIPAFAGMTD